MMTDQKIARFSAKCHLCGHEYPEGTKIIRRKGSWTHEKCSNKTVKTELPKNARHEAPGEYRKISKWVTKCPFCDERYPKGTIIAIRGGKWTHLKCLPENNDKKPSFPPTAQQLDFYGEIVGSDRNIVGQARAGTGKTSTAVWIFHKIAEDKPEWSTSKVAFFAFNGHIASHLIPLLPSYVHVSTLHSFGYHIVRSAFPKAKMREHKVRNILEGTKGMGISFLHDTASGTWAPKEIMARKMRVEAAVNLARCYFTEKFTKQDLDEILSKHSIFIDDELTEAVMDIVDKCASSAKDYFDFADMVWLPIYLGLDVPRFDTAFIDEAQDLNKVQRELAKRASKRIIAIGDDRQSIYGFAGADSQSIPNITEELNAKVMPLTVCWRCPKSHIERAQNYVPDIQAAPNAIEGELSVVSERKFDPQPGDMILCRTNAPLVPYALELIREEKKATIRGRDIGQQMVELCDRLFNHVDTVKTAMQIVEEYREMEDSYLSQFNSSIRLMEMHDQCDTIQAIAEYCEMADEIAGRIESIFTDDTDGIVFSSIHRVKGLEADRVWLLRPDKLPLNMPGMQPWEMAQEDNLAYVAFTRSKREFYIVEPPEERKR